MSKRVKVLAATAAVAALAAGCGSSSKSSTSSTSSSGSGGSSGGSGKTIAVGIITDETGPAASGNKTTPLGVQAGIALAARAGYKIQTYVGDTATSPSTALAAAQKLVEQDHVDVVIMCSALGFTTTNFLTQQGIPVIGAAEDGPEWMTAKNMFSIYGALDTTKVATTTGEFFKMEGATTIGAVGYSVSPSSSEAAKAAGVSAQHAGLKVGYIDAAFPFGSTNVAPLALQMKQAGVDGFTAATDPNTAFALIAALREAGDPPKVAELATGYGGDLAQAGAGALQTAQGVYFSTSFEPVEMHTAATEQFQKDLATAGVTGEPTYAEYIGYSSVALLVKGLQGDNGNTSHTALLNSLQNVTGFNDAGLTGSHTFSPGDRASTPVGVDACYYYTKLNGSNFELVPGADPLCGTEIPGVSVSASS